MIRLTLPWPSSELSQNARVHHAVKARAVKKARHDAYWLMKSENNGSLKDAGTLGVKIYITPPDRRRRDLDNILAALKPSFDGIADALGIDDSKWETIWIVRCPVDKPGRVIVTLEAT